jgi:ADP-dependent NAD(P)H-hydrate dehydratase / NAD(P)H-hydrate epimerase
MKILTAAEMQRVDRLSTEELGIPSLTLMENAGRAVVDFLAERFGPLESERMVIVAGRGNNGGDGMVVARLLAERGLRPRVILLADPKNLRGDAAANFARLSGLELEVATDLAAWQRARALLAGTTLLVDAILGTGLSQPLRGFFLEVVRDINSAFPAARVVAVDLPSGISADKGDLIGESLRADATVTFTAPKVAHVFPPASERIGEWVVRAIGTPAELLENDPSLRLNLVTRADVRWVAAPRAADSHKGNFGHVLVVAGSVGKTGAAALAAKAALRAGAGLVTVATVKSAMPIVAAHGMEYMTEPLPETEAGTISLGALDRLEKLLKGKTVVALGPGLGQAPETVECIRAAVNKYDLPLLLDADGLNAFAECPELLRPKSSGFRSPTILTPHPGEMARLTGKSSAEILANRVAVAREFAERQSQVLVLKGYRTLTASPDGQVYVNPTGNPGMATGGTGDVLTGLIAGLLAAFASRPAALVAAAGVFLHGLAGDIAARELGEASMMAGDLLDRLPRAFLSLAGNDSSSRDRGIRDSVGGGHDGP